MSKASIPDTTNDARRVVVPATELERRRRERDRAKALAGTILDFDDTVQEVAWR